MLGVTGAPEGRPGKSWCERASVASAGSETVPFGAMVGMWGRLLLSMWALGTVVG